MGQASWCGCVRSPLEGWLGLQLHIVMLARCLRQCCFNGQSEWDMFSVFLVVHHGYHI